MDASGSSGEIGSSGTVGINVKFELSGWSVLFPHTGPSVGLDVDSPIVEEFELVVGTGVVAMLKLVGAEVGCVNEP